MPKCLAKLVYASLQQTVGESANMDDGESLTFEAFPMDYLV